MMATNVCYNKDIKFDDNLTCPPLLSPVVIWPVSSMFAAN